MSEPTPEQLAKLPKWAQKHVIQTEQKCVINRALAWQSYEKPAPFKTDTIEYGKLQRLWFFNHHAGRFEISEGCSSGALHSRHDANKTTSQGAGYGFLQRVDALKACRCEMAEEYAIALAKIDAEIKKETLP